MLGQRVEAEVAARSADISMLTNEFYNMRLAAAEERAEILEELRKERSPTPRLHGLRRKQLQNTRRPGSSSNTHCSTSSRAKRRKDP